jgi:predicted ATPase/DNA-binding winged helix-turn-helix (wHTH) protein
MAKAAGHVSEGLSFGPFNLVASERLLTKDGVPVDLGARALDILITLTSAPNDVVSKKDLMSRVWPDVVVEEGSLRFHMTSLRKALGDGKNGARYITTIAGRGYCFVSPVSRRNISPENTPVVVVNFPHANLPGRLNRMVGRDEDVQKLSSHLTDSRFVTIVGAGGVGKTTVAVAVGHHLSEAFTGATLFVDLGMLSDPNLVSTAVASMLGLSVQSDDVRPSLMAHLREKRILLILDTCEHVVEAVAALAEAVMAAAPHVHILATSREALRIEGEHVYRLDSLACPPEDPDLTAEAVQAFPAAQLFVQRAVASGARLDISDSDASVVASICRKLDGVALAIELAARHVESYGLRQTAMLLDQSLALLWHGSRTAPPRQKTLHATLDWSYRLLSDLERLVLRRLAVFVGHFTLDAILEVVTSASVDQSAVLSAIDSLVVKSMVATRPIGAMVRYRLLDTTRAYALGITDDDSDHSELVARHAAYYRRWLDQAGTEWPTLSTGAERAPYFANLNNVRAALERCFGERGDVRLGIGLAAAAAPVFLSMSLLPECESWSERAILALDDAARGGAEEMHLQAALGAALMYTRGNSESTLKALNRSLAIAETRGAAPEQLRLLTLLHMFHQRIGDFKTTLHYAKQSSLVAETVALPSAIALAHCLLGSSLHHIGDLAGARAQLETALGPGYRHISALNVGFDHYNYADVALARTLWLQGYPAQAVERARRSVNDAESTGHPVPLSRALVWAISVFLWAGDLASADAHTDLLISHAESHSLGPYLAAARGYKGTLAISRGDAKSGLESLSAWLETLHAARYKLLTTAFSISLAQGFGALGRFGEGIALIDETTRWVETNGELSYMPELLRVKGGLLRSLPAPQVDDAEACFAQSLKLSRHQAARAWELRTATDLAALWAERGRSKDARALLLPVFEHFTEGSDTADLKAAERQLAALS